jgi:RNA polymerase sigma factor (sigma-70 family)
LAKGLQVLHLCHVLDPAGDPARARQPRADDPDPGAPGAEERRPEEEVDILLREDALRRALDQLPEQEREVVKLRYGVGGDEPTPLVETGRRLGISQDTVRRLERKALAELASSRELDALRPAA